MCNTTEHTQPRGANIIVEAKENIQKVIDALKLIHEHAEELPKVEDQVMLYETSTELVAIAEDLKFGLEMALRPGQEAAEAPQSVARPRG